MSLKHYHMKLKALIALPDGNESGGDKFLPTLLSNEIVSEPFMKINYVKSTINKY